MAKSKSKAQKSSKAKSKASNPKPKAGVRAASKAEAKLHSRSELKSKLKSKAKKRSTAKKSPMKKSAQSKPKLVVASKVATKPKSSVQSQAKTTPKLRLVSASASLNFVPLDDRILVQVEARAERTPGGLFIPDTVAERPNLGRIVAVGPGKRSKKGRLQPLDVRVGDEVMLAQWSGIEIEMPGQSGRFLILRESDLLGVKA